MSSEWGPFCKRCWVSVCTARLLMGARSIYEKKNFAVTQGIPSFLDKIDNSTKSFIFSFKNPAGPSNKVNFWNFFSPELLNVSPFENRKITTLFSGERVKALENFICWDLISLQEQIDFKGTVQQGQKGWDKPDFSLRRKMRTGDFLEFSICPGRYLKIDLKSHPMPLIHSRCHIFRPDAAYIFPMPLIRAGNV